MATCCTGYPTPCACPCHGALKRELKEMVTMQTFYADDRDGNRYEFHLHSLREYEADGGNYSDAGNGGEDMSDHKAEFLAALSGPHGDDYGDPDAAYTVAGVPRDGAWYDTTTGYLLLREWPAEAPLSVRMVGE